MLQVASIITRAINIIIKEQAIAAIISIVIKIIITIIITIINYRTRIMSCITRINIIISTIANIITTIIISNTASHLPAIIFIAVIILIIKTIHPLHKQQVVIIMVPMGITSLHRLHHPLHHYTAVM